VGRAARNMCALAPDNNHLGCVASSHMPVNTYRRPLPLLSAGNTPLQLAVMLGRTGLSAISRHRLPVLFFLFASCLLPAFQPLLPAVPTSTITAYGPRSFAAFLQPVSRTC